MSGLVLASPFAMTHPLAASTFVLASVAPDLDALSRVFGKRAFLTVHQTWSHALPMIALLGALVLPFTPAEFAVALVAGMSLHAVLDWTNTYGITLWAPFTGRRLCAEWVFFVDAIVLLLSAAALIAVVVSWPPGPGPAIAYATALLIYIVIKGRLRARALRCCPPETLALLPSALLPWRWFGCARDGDAVRLFRVEGGVHDEGTVPILDSADVEEIPEFRSMRRLSNAYHVVERTGDLIVCRDLRTRNFGARFGTLSLRNTDGRLSVERFDV